METANKARSFALGLAFNEKECPNNECAIVKLAIYNTGDGAVNDIHIVCQFSGPILSLNHPIDITFHERDGTLIPNPAERVPYRNNIILRKPSLVGHSFVIPILLIHQGLDGKVDVSCDSVKGDFSIDLVQWAEVPQWVTKSFDQK